MRQSLCFSKKNGFVAKPRRRNNLSAGLFIYIGLFFWGGAGLNNKTRRRNQIARRIYLHV